MAYLSKADWRKHLKNKALSGVKKTGLGDMLGDYEKAVKKSDASAQILSLEEIKSKCDELKKKYPKLPLLVGYLKSVAREAQIAEDRLSDRQEKAAGDNQLEGNKSPLAIALERQHKAAEDKQLFFVLAPGKPSSGLVIDRKRLKKEHIKKAIALRGKSGPFFQGTCFFDDGKYIFVFPTQPASGVAKSIKLAARLHAQKDIKVLVRGGGVEFDDESDIDSDMVGEERIASGGAANYPKPESWEALVVKVKDMPAEKQAGVLSGALGKVAQLLERASNDPDLDMQTRPEVTKNLKTAQQKLLAAVGDNTASKPSPQAAASYPSIEDWKALLEKCLRLDPDKRRPAIEVLRKKLVTVSASLKANTEITEQERDQQEKVLIAAAQFIKDGVAQYKETVKGARGGDLISRLQELERDYDAAQKQKILPDMIKGEMRKRFDETRQTLAKGNDGASELSLNDLEIAIKSVLETIYDAAGKQDRVAEQRRVHDSVAQGIELFKKASFAAGTADALFSEKNGAGKDKYITQLAKDFKSCEGNPSPERLAKLSQDGQAYLDLVAKASGKLNPEKPKDKEKLDALDKQADVARQAMQRVRLLELAQEIEAVGSPPWDESKTEKMAELQVQFFFEEGAIAQKNANFGAPPLGSVDEGGEGGANEAWWIQRSGGTGKKDTKTYIFKPQNMEATSFVGIPENGGSVREVLAKSTSDSLAKYGFDLGVCPTHLVEIDTAKLGGLAGGTNGAKTLGAMQELADNDGPVSAFVKNVTPAQQEEFKKSIDKKNFGDIAAFDMMFLNMDRHAGNLLVQKGPDGKNKLVPIDHGIGLMEPEGMKLNRQRMFGDQNVMMDDVFPNDSLLDPETRGNLQNIDAKAMADELRRKQVDMEKRHPESRGKIDHGEFDRIEKRVEFLKVASEALNIKQLFKANAMFVDEINTAKPSELPALVKKIKTKLDSIEAAKIEFDEIVVGLEGRNPDKALSNLGWAVGWGPDKTMSWIDENVDFVAKVIKGNIRNPDAVAELADGLRDLNNPVFEDSLKGQSLGERLEGLRKEIAKLRKANVMFDADKPTVTDQKTVDAEYQKLGGDKAYADAARIFSSPEYNIANNKIDGMYALRKLNQLGGEKALDAMFRVFDWYHHKQPDHLLPELAAWTEFNDMGGMKTYVALGGIKDERPSTAVEIFKGLKSLNVDNQREKILAIDDQKIQQEQINFVQASVEDYKKILPTIDRDFERDKFVKSFASIEGYVTAGEWNKAQGGLLRLLNQMDGAKKKTGS